MRQQDILIKVASLDKTVAFLSRQLGLVKFAGEEHGHYGNISESWGKKLLDAKASPATAANYVASRNKIINWGWNPFDFLYAKHHIKAEQSQEQNMEAYINKLRRDRYRASQKAQQQAQAATANSK